MCGRTQSLCFSCLVKKRKKYSRFYIRNSSTYFSRFSVSTRRSACYFFFLLFFRTGISPREILYFLSTPFLRFSVKITLFFSLNFHANFSEATFVIDICDTNKIIRISAEDSEKYSRIRVLL